MRNFLIPFAAAVLGETTFAVEISSARSIAIDPNNPIDPNDPIFDPISWIPEPPDWGPCRFLWSELTYDHENGGWNYNCDWCVHPDPYCRYATPPGPDEMVMCA